MRQTVKTALAMALLGLALPATPWAQEPVKTFDQLNTRLRVGDTVYVTDTAGGEHKGRLVDVSASSLTVRSAGTSRNFGAVDVRAIKFQQPDSLRNGVLIGLAVGAGFGMGCTKAITEDETTAGWAADLALVFAGAGAGIGALVDVLTPGKKLLVYSTSLASSAARVSVLPLVSPRRRGLAVSVRF